MLRYGYEALKCLSLLYTKCRRAILILKLLRINRFGMQIMKLLSGLEILLSLGYRSETGVHDVVQIFIGMIGN